MLEVEVDRDVEIAVNTNIEVTAGNMNVAIIEDTNDIEVTVNRQEYVITGDEIYIPKRFEDAPTWMQELITQVVDTSISAQIQDLNEISQSLESMIDAMEVAKNTYEMSVISSNDIDERINTAVTTLNSNMQDADATILEVAQTRTTPEEASAITIDVISAQLGSTTAGTIGATVSELQTAIANEEEARSTSIEILTSSIEGAFDANATAMNYLNTYVGVTEIGEKSGTGLLADVEILQKQNDGVIETTTGTYDVMINPENPNLAQLVTTSEPYATWRALDVTGIDNRLAHIGDVYVKYSDTTNGAKEYIASYKFIRTEIDNTSPYATDSEGFTWALVIDQAAQDAYEQALNAFDLADNKRRVFTSTPYSPIDEGDLWVTGTNPQVVKVYKNDNWILTDTQVDTFVTNIYTPAVDNLQNQIDGKVESWYTVSTSDPKTAWTVTDRAKHDGDMWYQTDTKKSYWYSSSTHTWSLIEDEKAIKALANAATAQATADGKITSYYMATFSAVQAMSTAWTASEKTNNIGDLAVVWNDTTVDNNGTWRWDGSNWVTTRDKKLVALASQVTALSTDLQSGDGTWADADSTLTNSLTTTINDKTATVESKFAYNSVIGINGIYKKSGFGLTTNYVSGSGTEVDPYASEFWIDASRFKFTNSNATGSVSPFTIDATGTVPQITFNGKVSFSNVTNVPSFDSSSNNLLTNSAPKLGDETQGWQTGWYNTNIVPSAVAPGSDPWRPTGAGSVYVAVFGSPTVGTVFDIRQSNQIPVVAGKRYEISALLSSHRCTSKCTLAFFNSAGTYISEIGAGLFNNVAYVGDLSTWSRNGGFVTVPAGTAYAHFYVRSTVTGTDPHCFVAQAYMGEVPDDKTKFSTWSEGISASNNEVFAQNLGYLSYSDMVTAATNGKTIINGGYLRTSLIEANAITANHINAYAIVGKHISGGTIDGTEINGTKINGAVINGARINGAVIKASYLDLDGELEVLTNYHISVAMFNSNPSLYKDAVFISADDEYRIPSLSVLNWNGGSASTGAHQFFVSGTFSASLNTGLHAYNVSDAGVNTKAVKIKPVMSINGITMKTGVYGINDLSAPYSVAHCIMYFGNIQLCKLRLWTYPQESGGRIRFTIERYGQSSLNGVNNQLDGTTFNILGISFSVSSYVYDYPLDMNGNSGGRDVETTITVTKAIGELWFNFLSGSIRFDVYAEKPTFSDCRASVSSTGININNMV